MGDTSPRKRQSPLHQYAVYSNMAFEMGIVIALGVLGGVKLDEITDLSPLFAIVCSLLSIAVALYLVVRSITRNTQKKKDEQKNPD